MCIRDRRDGALVVDDQLALLLALGDMAERIQRGTAQEPEAVSYTHLRAHETVLDLVCRLLLEKKKQ